jgi:amidase
MASHRFLPHHFHNTIGSHAPALSIGDGDTVVTDTVDAHGFDHRGVQRAHRPNPMTGPFHVEGAEPGDALAVRIDAMTLTRPTGWTYQSLSENVVDPGAVARLPPRTKVEWAVDARSGFARLAEPPPALAAWQTPLAPMIGCFGVAPAMGQAISTATSGPYGGNMDYRLLGPGIEIMFPVAVPGALFFLGDVHAAQGCGEIPGTGIETTAEITFTVRVLKNHPINWPRGETVTDIFTIGNARPLEQALQHATSEMLSWLQSGFGLDAVAAAHIMGQQVRYDIANVFNPAFSVACRIARGQLPR